MDDQSGKVHRTWVQLLVDSGQKEAAAIAIDTEVNIVDEGYKTNYYENESEATGGTISVEFHVPTAFYNYVKSNNHLQTLLEQAMSNLLKYRVLVFHRHTGNGFYEQEDMRIEVLHYSYHVQFISVDEGWKDTIRALIAGSAGITNQGLITELMFAKVKKEPILYNGLKFASQSEVRIAQELAQRKVLFFPLAVGVKADTGQPYQDQREVDFLVCYNGAWGVLEVSGPSHDGRFAADSEKDTWFKQSGILCIEHRRAEQCYNNPKKVTEEFLGILAQYKQLK